ncbi:tyrosine-type recombinase/integrase [Antarctobacter sp.]|uniref:tyrosine-type recombinase/integrase n=1 Tax=Antarctobacter sp. TaxID=1872577 RepID=UPI002B2733F5|nr:integrase arm-type DNA-binding domain-containing protein [Antarctobacter sp.]
MPQDAAPRRPEKALTAQRVKNATEPGKYFDGNGLYLLVKPNGSRSWVQRIVIRGKRREMGLGSASLVALAEAREAALQNRKVARAGGDPIQAKLEALAVLTFEEAARKVHEMHRPTWRNAKHAAQFISTLETYAFLHIGKVKVGDVNTNDVLRVLSPIWTEKPETARRVRQRIGMVMKWAVAKGWRQDNPAEAISQALPKHERRKAHRKALPYQDVSRFLQSVQASKAGAVTKLAIEFLILTAARSGEARNAVWSEVDLGAGIWTVPADRMKSKREHRVPLSPRAVEILTAARGFSDGSELIFPGTKRGRPLSDMTLSKLTKELGFDVDIHGFRTSFRTWAQEQTDAPREVAEAALAHTIRNQAEAAYARSDLFERRRELMERWGQSVRWEI